MPSFNIAGFPGRPAALVPAETWEQFDATRCRWNVAGTVAHVQDGVPPTMCGILGAACAGSQPALDEVTLLGARDAMTHRGPDDAGHFLAPGVALASRRLAILDLSARGHMPMRSADGRYVIVHNGEVYNYRELRGALEARGHRFRSNTDTEVLLALYADTGPAMLEKLNGMFAFAIWDTRDRRLFLARDRVGIKPLYYGASGDTLVFASEEKVLFAAGVPAEFDASTMAELLRFNYVAGERTPFSGVRRLLPGHYMLWRDGTFTAHRWWNLSKAIGEPNGDLSSQLNDGFREIFDSSVNLRRISDVPVGVLLSGGLDSSSVASSLAAQGGGGTASFTVRFNDPHYDEGPLAELVADRWRLQHHELVVPRNELLERLRTASWLNDEPLAHYSDLHISAIAAYAKSRVTVLLSGEGADEILGGYVRYWPLRHPSLLTAQRALIPGLSAIGRNARLHKLRCMLALGDLDELVLFNASNVFPDDLAAVGISITDGFEYRRAVVREARDAYPGEPARQAMYSDVHTFLCSLLDRNDRMTMGASIECRVPFLDYRLIEGLAALPSRALLRGRRGKRLLLDAVGDRLPPAIRRARKWGFSVPWARYLREQPELRSVLERLHESPALQSASFDERKVRETARQFLSGTPVHDALVVRLFTIAVWHDAYWSGLADLRSARTPTQSARSRASTAGAQRP